MSYVDGYLLPVPKKNIKDYKGIAKKAGKIWRDHGALQYIEAAADDLENEWGVSLGESAGTRKGETVVFAFIVFKDKVNKRVMKDPRMKKMMNPDDKTFECKRMAYGGFKVIVDA